MIEVLIISYNALPMDVVSSYRVKAYCDHFKSFGINPTILTHRWEKCNDKFLVHGPDGEVIIEENQDYRVIRLPYPGSNASPSSFHTLCSYLKGDLDVGLLGSYRVFKEFLLLHLEKKRYQLIISVYNPHFHLKLAYLCWQKFRIPYVLDFRDLWNNDIVTESYRPSSKQVIVNWVISYWWKRWMRQCLFFATTGHKWRVFLSELSRKDGITVRNGFDHLPCPRETQQLASRKFKIIHFGRMYRRQDIDVFLQGFKTFAQKLTPSEIGFEVIGLKSVPEMDFRTKIKGSLGDYVTFIPYMTKSELFDYCSQQASLFFFPDFKEDNGSFAVKVYDYVAIGKNVLVAPGGGEVSRFVSSVSAGWVFNDSESVTRYLETSYKQFKATGSISFNLDKNGLEVYARRTQVQLMAARIKEELYQM